MKSVMSYVVLAGLFLNPVASYASVKVVLNGPYESKTTVSIDGVEGTILAAKPNGIYVKVLKDDLKLENHMNPEILKFADLHHDKDWDRSHVLLFIPKSALTSENEVEDRDQEMAGRETFDCFLEGKQVARNSLSTGGSSLGGFAGGLFLGLLGVGIAVVAQSDPRVPHYLIPEEDGKDCEIAFIEGFQDAGKGKKRNAALTGGILGTLTLVVIIVAANSGS